MNWQQHHSDAYVPIGKNVTHEPLKTLKWEIERTLIVQDNETYLEGPK